MHHAIPTMNGLSTIEFQDNQPIAHENNYYKYILWALNLLQLPTRGDSDL